MVIEDIMRSQVLDKIESLIHDLEEDIKFVNVSGDKWQVQISFDISSLPVSEKDALAYLLNFL